MWAELIRNLCRLFKVRFSFLIDCKLQIYTNVALVARADKHREIDMSLSYSNVRVTNYGNESNQNKHFEWANVCENVFHYSAHIYGIFCSSMGEDHFINYGYRYLPPSGRKNKPDLHVADPLLSGQIWTETSKRSLKSIPSCQSTRVQSIVEPFDSCRWWMTCGQSPTKCICGGIHSKYEKPVRMVQ